MIAFKFLLISTLSVLGSSAASVNGEPGQPVISRNEPIFNGTRIVYPSEDTNQKRRPTHVSSSEVGKRELYLACDFASLIIISFLPIKVSHWEKPHSSTIRIK